MRDFASTTRDPYSAARGFARRPGMDELPGAERAGAPGGLLIHRKAGCACGGGCPSCQTKSSGLKVSEPNDAAEIEADRIADQVMRMPNMNGISSSENSVQRKRGSNESISHVSPTIRGVINSPSGKSLDKNIRSFMESRFNYDFSDVKIHTDDKAAESARSINALAYTAGNNIVFESGQYDTNSDSGRRVLAHELAHVVQQNSNTASGVQRLIRQSLVNCPGNNVYPVDRRASALLEHVLNTIDAAVAARAADPANADVISVSDAMHRAFRLNAANDRNWNDPAPHFGIPLIRRRVQGVKNYIDSVVFTITCGAAGAVVPLGTCTAVNCNGPNAWSCPAEPSTLVLCPPFWALPNNNQRARTFIHELFHITFQSIDDWANPDSTNAHCYAQFVALLNGFNPPTGLRCH